MKDRAVGYFDFGVGTIDPACTLGSNMLQGPRKCIVVLNEIFQDSDSKAEQSGTVDQFKEYPRKAQLVDQPVLTTLYYCAFYHFDLGDNNLASPRAVKNQHKVRILLLCQNLVLVLFWRCREATVPPSLPARIREACESFPTQPHPSATHPKLCFFCCNMV